MKARLVLALWFVLGAAPVLAQQDGVLLWHAYDDREGAALREVLDRFEAQHGVQVRDVRLPFGVLASRLESAVRTGNGPDLFIDAHERLGRYAAMHIVQPLRAGDALERTAAELEGSDALQQDGARFGLPLALKALALYVNRDLVGEGGTLEARLRSVRPHDGIWPLVTEAENAYYAAPFLHAFGAEIFSAEDGFRASSPEGARALARLRAFQDEGWMPSEADGALVARLFGSGQAAYAISGPWLASSLPQDLNYAVVPLPELEGEGILRPFVTVEAIYRAAGPANAHAEALARFLSGAESASVRARVAGQIVSHRRVGGEDQGDAAAFRAAAQQGVPMPTDARMSQTFEPLSRALRGVLRGGMDPAEALEDSARRYARAVRPLPPAKEPELLLLLLGFALLGVLIVGVRALRRDETKRSLRASMSAYRYLALAALGVLLLVIAPLVAGAAMSFFATDGSELRYVGLSHYGAILSGDGMGLLETGSFWRVLLVTALWTLLNLALHIGIGIGLALLLHRKGLRFRGVYRVLLIVPWAVPNYVTALSWKGMFHSQYGAVNGLLGALGVEPVHWFSAFSTAFAANVTTNVWLGFPFMMVVALGALSSVPKELYEAAEVDGATPLQRLRHITLPLLWPAMIPAIAMGAVWTFNMFNVVFLVSGGEPGGSTEILVSEAYRWAFTRGARYGYAAAYAVLIFGVLWMATRVRAVRGALQ